MKFSTKAGDEGKENDEEVVPKKEEAASEVDEDKESVGSDKGTWIEDIEEVNRANATGRNNRE